MVSKLIGSKTNSSSIYIYDFYYYDIDGTFIFLGETKYKSSLVGKVAIRTPYWPDIYDINRISKGVSRDNPLRKKEIKIFPNKYKENKIKVLVEYIEDCSGLRHGMSSDFVENMDAELARFVLEKIDEVFDDNPIVSMQDDESKKLSTDCYNYFAAVAKSKSDPKIEIPDPPSIVVLYRLAKMLDKSIDDVKKMDKRDIDAIMIMNQQESITKNPAMIGMGSGGPGSRAIGGKGKKYDMVFTGHNIQINREIDDRSISKKDIDAAKPKKQEKSRKSNVKKRR